jgi:hypothetical protein
MKRKRKNTPLHKLHIKRVFRFASNVARLLEISDAAVCKWHEVPEEYHEKLIASAKERGYELTIKQLRNQE